MSELVIEVDMRLQQLYLWEPFPDGDLLIRQYPVSTAANGAGEKNGSYCTPRGRHRIAEKIGAGAPLCAAFKSRQPTGARLNTRQPRTGLARALRHQE